MSQTIVLAQLLTNDGVNVRSYISNDPDHAWEPLRHRSWATPASEVRTVQAAEIPLRFVHGGPPIGRILVLQRRHDDQSLWCAGELNEDFPLDPERDRYLSVETTYDEDTGADVEITGAALCERTRAVALQPAVFVKDGLILDGRSTTHLGTFLRDLLDQADKARRERWRTVGQPLRVRESFDPRLLQRATEREMALAAEQQRPVGPIRHGARGSVLRVR
jgi:hypothetical protein